MEKEGGRDIKKISQHLLDRRSHPRLIFERLLDPEKAFSMGYQKLENRFSMAYQQTQKRSQAGSRGQGWPIGG